MTWREQLRRASFRGAPFHVDGTDADIGRRVVTHEYPLRDKPFAEDLGRRARGLTLEAYVIGPDYMAARDRLIAALEAEGPGTLVHPYWGTLRVSVTQCRVRESTREGGMARFSLTVVESGEREFPSSAANTAVVVDTRADTALNAIREAFEGDWNVAGPAYLRESGATLVSSLADALEQLPVGTVAVPAGLTGWITDVAALRSSALAAVLTPATLADQVIALLGQVTGLAATPRGAFERLRSLWTWGETLAPVPTTTTHRQRQAANQQALRALVGRAAVVEAARTASGVDWAHYQEAATTRDLLSEQMDVLALSADDSTYPALQQLRAAVVSDITRRGADLARVIEYSAPTTMPALLLAHRIYGDATQAEAVLARNPRRVRHPGFVPGGVPLEVLTHAT